MQRLLVGCTGWGYDDWRGGFYPPGTPPAEYLERYARVFRLAEVDSTYYRAPGREQAARWAQATPGGFTFTPKVPGAITHEAALRGAEGAFAAFVAALEPLRQAGKLGPLVLQMPPSFAADKDADALRAFLAQVPSGVRVAVELRNASWWRPETYRMLEAAGATLVWSENQYAPTPPVLTSDAAYVRLIGDRSIETFGRIQVDKRDQLAAWARRVREEGAGAREVFVLLNNHFMGFAPATAAMMMEALELPPPDLSAAARTAGQRALLDYG